MTMKIINFSIFQKKKKKKLQNSDLSAAQPYEEG